MPEKYNLSDFQSMYGVNNIDSNTYGVENTDSNSYSLGDMQNMFGIKSPERYNLGDIKQMTGNLNPEVPDTFLDEWMPDWIKKVIMNL